MPRSVGALLAACALLALVGFLFSSLRNLSTATDWVEHTTEVKVAIGALRASMLEAESDQRGYLLTGDPRYLDDCDRATDGVLSNALAVRRLTADNAKQQAAMGDVERLTAARIAELTLTLRAHDESGPAAAVAGVRASDKLGTMDQLLRVLTGMDAEEDRLAAERRQVARSKGAGVLVAIVVSSLLLSLAAGLGWYRQRIAEERQKAAERENAVLAERARTTEFQERFVGVLGHDLRNPLGSITMGIDLLGKSAAEGIQQRTLARMAKSAARMTHMIEQLLDLTRSRIGSGIPVEAAPMDLAAVTADVVAELRAVHPSRSIEIAQTGDTRGEWDVARLGQVVSNLVGNALSYGSMHTPVRIELSGDGEQVSLVVRNEGPAIPAAVGKVIFEPFRRGQRDSRGLHTSGLGLGLHITRQIVRAHEGTVELTSTVEAGTAFTVNLPRGVGARKRAT